MRFDIEQLTERLLAETDWVGRERSTADLPVGYFGASTGAAAALAAASCCRTARAILAPVSSSTSARVIRCAATDTLA
jgi:hypothetical protein